MSYRDFGMRDLSLKEIERIKREGALDQWLWNRGLDRGDLPVFAWAIGYVCLLLFLFFGSCR